MKTDSSPTSTSEKTVSFKDQLTPTSTDGPGKETPWFSEAEPTRSPASSSTPGVTVTSSGELMASSSATLSTDGDITSSKKAIDWSGHHSHLHNI